MQASQSRTSIRQREECAGGAACTLNFRDWTGNRNLSSVGTNVGSAPIAFQRWRSFKEAFTPEFVEHAIRDMRRRVRHVVDPFGGSGTTGLAAQFLGVRPTLIETNPYLIDLIWAKLAPYSIDEVRDSFAGLIDYVHKTETPHKPQFPGAPKTFIEPGLEGRYIFSKQLAARILVYRDAIQKLPNPQIQRLFRAILGGVLISVSNVVISGKGRRYRHGWRRRQAKSEALDELFLASAEMAIYDIHKYEARLCKEYTVLHGDSRKLVKSIDQVDLAVFSPPYPNSFDYTDVYNVELWSLGYLDSSTANMALRQSTLRSHVQITRDMSGAVYNSQLLRRTYNRLNRVRPDLWNDLIPEMINGYFSDMGDVLKALAEKLSKNGRIYMVVGDSRYAGVHVPVADILSEIAPDVGLALYRSQPCRSMRVSPQQGGQHCLAETLIVLRKP